MRVPPPPQAVAVAESGGYHSVHVSSRVDTDGTRAKNPSPDT